MSILPIHLLQGLVENSASLSDAAKLQNQVDATLQLLLPPNFDPVQDERFGPEAKGLLAFLLSHRHFS